MKTTLRFLFIALSCLFTATLASAQIAITSPVSGTTYTAGNTIAATATCNNCFLSGVASITFSLPGLANIVDNSSPYTASFNTSTLAAGSYTLTATAVSNLGSTTTTSITVNIASLAPSIPIDINTAAPNTVPENSANGTLVGLTAYSSDPQFGTNSTNLALNKPATASSYQDPNVYAASKAVDGDYTTTRWASAYLTDPSYLTVDLGANYDISRVKISWQTAYATAYQIQVSTDGTNFTTIKTVTGNTTLVNDNTGLSAQTSIGRYVRINGTARALAIYGYSIYELEVYGSDITYSLTNSANGRFTINPTTGVVSVADGTQLDYETNTSHSITVQASTGTYTSTQNFTIAVTNVNEAPVITSNGGTATASVSVVEATTAVTTVTATDVDAGSVQTYSISGGADAAKFSINSSTGALNFITAPAYAAPSSAAGTNAYTVIVTSTDNGSPVLSDSQTLTVNVTAAAGLTSYGFSKPLVLNTSSITGGITSTLTNFPALVYIQDNALIIGNTCGDKVQYPLGNGNGLTGGTNYDFAFTVAGSTTELNYQVDTYDSVNGILLAWVQIPTLTSTNKSITFYFGSLNPAHNAAFSAATWSSDYMAVYHFNEGSTTATVLDATSNGRNAIQTNTTLSNDEIHVAASLPITGGGYSFDGSSTKIVQGFGTNADITGKFTLSAWVLYNGSSSSDNKIISDELNYGKGYKLSVKSGKIETETRNTSNSSPGNLFNSGTVSSGTWTYIQGVYDGSKFINYVNGVSTSTTVTNSAPEAGNVINLGIDYLSTTTATNYYNGYMDEVRISNTAKTSDWINAEYYNQKNPKTFTNYSGALTEYQANAQTLPGALVYTWTGATSTDPTVATNWTNTTIGAANQLPLFTGSSTLVIPTGLSKYPALTADEAIYGLTIGSGASLNLNGHTLSVGCNIYNSSGGQILYAGSTASGITWNGSLANQTYTGSTASNTAQTGNMTISNTSAGTITTSGGPVDIYNILKITKGNLVIDNTKNGVLNLKSAAGQTAAVDSIPSGYSISGKVNAERFITGTSSVYRGYRLISSPVNVIQTTSAATNYISLSYLNASANGNYGAFTGGPGAGFSVTNPNPTIYMYNETLKTSNSSFISGKNVGIYSITGNTVKTISSATGSSVISADLSIPVGNGFIMYFVGATNGRTSGSTATAITSATLTANGYLNQRDVSVNLWYTPGGATGTTTNKLSYGSTDAAPNIYKGYNMVGNPYACPIDLNTFYTNNSAAISGNFYELYNQSTGQNQTYVVYSTSGTSSSNASRYVASGQGFFVVASGINKTITFKETQKSASTQATALSTLMSAPGANQLTRTDQLSSFKSFNSLAETGQVDALAGFHLKVAKDTTVSDECGIYFNKQWLDTYDINDAYDLDGAAPKVYLSSFTADGVRTALNKLSGYANGKRIKLYVKATADGMYSISMPDIQNIDTVNYKINLIDHFKNDSLDIGKYKIYNFNITNADTASFGANRLELAIEQINTSKYKLLSFTAQKATGGVLLTWRAGNEGNNYFYTLEKQQSSGVGYSPIYQVQSNGGSNYKFTDKNPNTGNNVYRLKQVDLLGNISYSAAVNIYYDQTGNDGLFTVYPNPTAETLHVNITYGKANNTADSYKLTIYDATGSVVMQKTSVNTSWSENVGNFKPGIYIVELKSITGNSLGKAKFVKK